MFVCLSSSNPKEINKLFEAGYKHGLPGIDVCEQQCERSQRQIGLAVSSVDVGLCVWSNKPQK